MTAELNRRGFLKRGILGGALLLIGGSAGLALRRTRVAFVPGQPLKFFTPEEFAIYAAFAERIIPGGPDHPSASKIQVAEKCDVVMSRAEPGSQKEFKQLLHLFDNALASLLFDLRLTPFTQLDAEAQDKAIDQWRMSSVTLRRSGYQALKRLACACYYGSPETHTALGYRAPQIDVEPASAPASEPASQPAGGPTDAATSAPASAPAAEVAP